MDKHLLDMMLGTFSLLLILQINGDFFQNSLQDQNQYFVSHKSDTRWSENSIKSDINIEYIPDLKSIRTYLTKTSSPFIGSDEVAQKFLSSVTKRNSELMIRNGNLTDASRLAEKHQKLLESLGQLRDSLHILESTTKPQFNKIWKHLPMRDRKKMWQYYANRRSALRKSSRDCMKQLKLTVGTELAILRQRNHFPELAKRMNSLYNLDSSKLPVYVFFHQEFTQALQGKLGMSIISWHDGVYTTDSPAARHFFPDLPGVKKALTVHLTNRPSGKVLSHEFGHLYYLYHHWQEYQQYVQSMGCKYELGGHGQNDPSGIAAELAERGILRD